MAAPAQQARAHWSSRFTFIMAAVGSAVGLGNFWRFPYETGVNGGGAFVIVYLACVLLVAMPLVISELTIGRRGKKSIVGSISEVAKELKRSKYWSIIGWFGLIASFLILSFYSVIAGWVIAYIPKAMTGTFNGIDAAGTGAIFNDLLAQKNTLILWHSCFIALTAFIVWRGLNQGIEFVVNILMPVFFVLLVLLAGYAMYIGDLGKAVSFLFSADFSKITPRVAVAALGQAFFSVGVGVGIMITYGSYLNKEVHIPHSAGVIAVADTLVAIVAGLLIFPIVFGFNLDPGQGPGLIFVTLPIAFGQMAFGAVIATAFFTLALVAAITSSISMLEIFVAWAEEHRGLKRHSATIVGGVAAWAIGLITVFSFNDWAEWYPLGFLAHFEGLNPFGLIDYFTGKVLLPLGGLTVAIFSGWFMTDKLIHDEIRLQGGAYSLWRVLVKFVSPVAVTLILLSESGLVTIQSVDNIIYIAPVAAFVAFLIGYVLTDVLFKSSMRKEEGGYTPAGFAAGLIMPLFLFLIAMSYVGFVKF